jgi:PPOX class probable F420-dependent enzyme
VAVTVSLDPNDPKHAGAEERLRAELIVWLTTVGDDGQPQSTPVWFAWHGGEFLLYSRPDAAKLRNIAARPQVGLHLEGNRVGGDNVIFEGEASLPDDAPPADQVQAYIDKYGPRIEQYGWTRESFANDYSRAIRVTPTRVRIW